MAESNWDLANWEGLRLQQRREFLSLPLRKKLEILEQMNEVSAFFRARRLLRGLPVSDERKS